MHMDLAVWLMTQHSLMCLQGMLAYLVRKAERFTTVMVIAKFLGPSDKASAEPESQALASLWHVVGSHVAV